MSRTHFRVLNRSTATGVYFYERLDKRAKGEV